MKPESKFYRSVIKPSLSSAGVMITRIENSVGSGIPDILAVKDNVYKLIELKVSRSNRIYFRPTQVAYYRKLLKHKSTANVLIAHSDNHVYILDTCDVVHYIQNNVIKPTSAGFSILFADISASLDSLENLWSRLN